VFSTRIGYTLPFNEISDFDLGVTTGSVCDTPGQCVNVAPLGQIDADLKLPLTERYFLGGVGSYQLRGFKARSVGPRRPILRQFTTAGGPDLFLPVGTRLTGSTLEDNTNFTTNNKLIGVCDDTGQLFLGGNLNGVCNKLTDRDIDDFADLDETDVIGGASFIATSFEYRFPISDEVGLQGVVFADMGNAFAEGENLFDVTEWRYGVGGGVLWFSPFGPLQVVLGFPLDALSIEKSPVFEFSVGGAGL
jgi:outer membrane protein assembly factor BamA